jgi:hypothetical protein
MIKVGHTISIHQKVLSLGPPKFILLVQVLRFFITSALGTVTASIKSYYIKCVVQKELDIHGEPSGPIREQAFTAWINGRNY